MKSETIYHFKKSREQQAKIFRNMAVCCLLYIAGLYGYEHFTQKAVPENFRSIFIIGLSIACLILSYVVWWLKSHPAVYEVSITKDLLSVSYPGSEQWSFSAKVSDIKRFEHRKTLSHAGSGIGCTGVLMNDGKFHELGLNYGPNLKKMFEAVKSVNPSVTFPKTVNKKVSGLLEKDFDD